VLPAAAAGASAAPSAESATVGRVESAPTVAGPGGAPLGVAISAATAGPAAGRAHTGSVAGGASAGVGQSAAPASSPVPRVSSMAIAVPGAMAADISAARQASATDAGPYSGATPSMDGALAGAAAVAPPVVVFGNGSGTPAAAPGPGIWGSPSDGPAAADPGQPIRRRSRARAPPVVIRGVRDGAAAHLQDASEVVKAEWEAVEPATIAHCWVKSTILPNGLAMDVTALHGEYRASSRSIPEDVSSVVTAMGGCGFGERAFSGSPMAVMEGAVEKWLAAEDDEGVLAATADRMVFDEGEGEDASEDDDE